jgi:hypothetical protein
MHHITQVTMPRDAETQQHFGYAYIEFRRPMHAACALFKFNFAKLRNRYADACAAYAGVR